MIGQPDRPRQPFKMLPSRWAQARYSVTGLDGKTRQKVRSGRASFVWLNSVLVSLASGVTDSVEIRRDMNAPWHTITGSDNAYRQIVDHYPLLRGLRRVVESHRTRRGLPIDNGREEGSR